MADAIPASAGNEVIEETPKPTKKASKAVSAEVKEAVSAEAPKDASEENPFKAAGGVQLESHDAIREDF